MVTDPEPYPVAYLRVAGGRLIEKAGWTSPGVEELRAMLGLRDNEGMEGLDEAGRDLLEELRQSDTVTRDTALEETKGEDPDMSGLTVQDLGEEVRFNKRDKWFVASITGITRADESIGEELKRCFDLIQGTFPRPFIMKILMFRNPHNSRLIPTPAFISHHTPPTLHVTLPSRQYSLLYIFRYLSPITSYCCCSLTLWISYTLRSGRIR